MKTAPFDRTPASKSRGFEFVHLVTQSLLAGRRFRILTLTGKSVSQIANTMNFPVGLIEKCMELHGRFVDFFGLEYQTSSEAAGQLLNKLLLSRFLTQPAMMTLASSIHEMPEARILTKSALT